jgi:hypothetical protein
VAGRASARFKPVRSATSPADMLPNPPMWLHRPDALTSNIERFTLSSGLFSHPACE